MSTPFSEWITPAARAAGYTTSGQLANALGINRSTISRWEYGGHQPSVKHLARISDVFGVDLRELLAMAGHITPDQAGRATVGVPPMIREGHVAVSREDLRIVLAGPLPDPVGYVAAARRLHAASGEA